MTTKNPMVSEAKQTPIMIHDWPTFAGRVRSEGCHLLRRLDDFPDSILVTGCQRSGTTMLSRIITKSDGMVNYWFGRDDELDAALILSGMVVHKPEGEGRYCFQTTYVNGCFREYFDYIGHHRLVWVLRNPYSVIYSMMHNWKAHAFDELFVDVGAPLLTGFEKWQYRLLGASNVPRIKRACLAYNGKLSHLFALIKEWPPQRLAIVEYDELVANKHDLLPAVYDFINLPYQSAYADKIHSKSIQKSKALPEKEVAVIHDLCQPIYERAKSLDEFRISIA